MATLICGSCQGRVDDTLLRASPDAPDGSLRCPHCGRRQRLVPSAPGRSLLLVALGTAAVIVLPAMFPAGSLHKSLAIGAGAGIFAALAGWEWSRRRRLLPAADAPGAAAAPESGD